MTPAKNTFDSESNQFGLGLQVSDETLVKGVLNGDDSAFEQLFLRHRKRIVQIVGRFFTHPERIEDLVQEVFTKLFFVLSDYSARSDSSFAAWISRIAINVCYDQLRSARRRPEHALEISSDETELIHQRIYDPNPTRTVESTVISRDLVHKLLARLDPEDQLVLTLLDVEELSVAEIAEATGWTASKVKVRAHRARHALRRVLNEFT